MYHLDSNDLIGATSHDVVGWEKLYTYMHEH
jgi:hypothetical protein